MSSRLYGRDLSLLQEDGSLRGLRLSGRISALPACLRTDSSRALPGSAKGGSAKSVTYDNRMHLTLSHKRPGLFGRGGRLCDTLPELTRPPAQAYYQLKRRNHELIDMVP